MSSPEQSEQLRLEAASLHRDAPASDDWGDKVAAMIAATETRFGAVDILVNNTGIQFVAPVEQFPAEKWDAILAINLSSNFHAIRAALSGMKSRGWGRIINVASAHGLVASPFKSAYVAAKHGVVSLTKAVALEAAESGVTCSDLPGLRSHAAGREPDPGPGAGARHASTPAGFVTHGIDCSIVRPTLHAHQTKTSRENGRQPRWGNERRRVRHAGPGAGAEVAAGIRRAMLRGFPYFVLYRLVNSVVEVLAIAHHRRRPDYWHGRVAKR